MKVAHVYIRNFRGIKSLSWNVDSAFNCIIGAGDTGKTTILTALDYALTPRTSLSFDDSDFFEQDVTQRIVIQITLTDWDETRPEVQTFFQEKKFAQYKCGLDQNGPISEPNDTTAISVSLNIDAHLEPKWFVVKGLDADGTEDRAPLWGSDRNTLGVSRIDIFSDFHFTWGNNTILTRLSADNQANPNAILSDLAREMRRSDISQHPSVAECQTVADTVKSESKNAGVNLTTLAPKIDLQRRSMTAGALSLHEDNVPLRNKGTGSKKLIAAAMQMKLHDGKNVSLIDELEVGLEPHRIRGLIHKLKNSKQQIFTTTHSPVVIRELSVSKNELHVCKRASDGTVTLNSLGTVPKIQGSVRKNAEAFLGSKVVACEGATEIGCLRAYDVYRFSTDNAIVPVWSLATSYFDCGSLSQVKPVCPKLIELGYRVAALCDNDDPNQLSETDTQNLREEGVHICQWNEGNSTEMQLTCDLPWSALPQMLEKIAEYHDTLEHTSILNTIRKAAQAENFVLPDDVAAWCDSLELRKLIGKAITDGDWIKRMDYSANVFQFAFSKLPDESVIKQRLDKLWQWIQDE